MTALLSLSWLNGQITMMHHILVQGYWQYDVPSTLQLAQAFQNDLGGSVQDAWNNFIQSGQVWALIIGFVVGYIFRAITSY